MLNSIYKACTRHIYTFPVGSQPSDLIHPSVRPSPVIRVPVSFVMHARMHRLPNSQVDRSLLASEDLLEFAFVVVFFVHSHSRVCQNTYECMMLQMRQQPC
jgi:hypothetical protein